MTNAFPMTNGFSSIQYPESSIRYQGSIQYPESSIKYQSFKEMPFCCYYEKSGVELGQSVLTKGQINGKMSL